MRIKVCAFLAILLALFFLSACFDSHETRDFVYISVMGIEKGEVENYKFTFQMPKFTMNGQGQSGQDGEGKGEKEDNSASFITLEAPSLLSAAQITNTNISKKLNFMHLKAIIISEELALSGKVEEYIAPLCRYRQIRRSSLIIVCKGKAQDFVDSIKPYSGELVTQTLEQLIKKSEETGYFPKVTLNDFYDGLKAPYHALLGTYGAVNKEAESKPGEGGKQNESNNGEKSKQKESGKNGDYYAGDIPRTGGEKIELFGSTLFDGDKMVGKLTGFETQMLLLARGEIKYVPFAISDPKEPQRLVSLEITEFEKPKINMDMTNVNKPKIHLKIKLEGNITFIQSRINYESVENKKIIETAVKKYLADGIKKTYSKCKDFKTDVFNFGTVAAKYFLTIPEWEEYNWLSKFPESELKVEVDFTIRRTGQIINTVPIFSTEGKQ